VPLKQHQASEKEKGTDLLTERSLVPFGGFTARRPSFVACFVVATSRLRVPFRVSDSTPDSVVFIQTVNFLPRSRRRVLGKTSPLGELYNDRPSPDSSPGAG